MIKFSFDTAALTYYQNNNHCLQIYISLKYIRNVCNEKANLS